MTEKPEIYVQQQDIVVPGDLIAEGDVELMSVFLYKYQGKVYASVPGIVEHRNYKLYFTPFELAYIPKQNDIVIGMVVDIGTTYWSIDINSPYKAQLPASETIFKQTSTFDNLIKYLDVGDFIVARVLSFDRNRDPVLSAKGKELGKIVEGKIIEVKLTRIPWIMGKKKTMIEAIAKETGTRILVANNARIWVKGDSREDEDLAILAIKKIESWGLSPPTITQIIDFIKEQKEGKNR